MEARRRSKWDSSYNNYNYHNYNNYNNNDRRSQNKRPPRVAAGNWQPTVPKWEKEFCKVVGSLDWETLLHMKKFTHLYEDVINWDDSAGEEAFLNAKKRFWAEINGLSCHLPSPDPDLYIDEIDWDSRIDADVEPEPEPMNSNADGNHDPVIIFGDSLFANQAYSLSGWGDEEEKSKGPDNIIASRDPWEQNGDNSFDNWAAIGSGGGSTNEWDWNQAKNNNNTIYRVGPEKQHGMAREWSSFNSCGRANHRAAITVGQRWNR